MLASFFILLCRNPKFDAMGIYTQMKDNILYPVFDSMCKEDEESEKHDIENNEGKEYADELMTGIWYSELYKMFFKNSGGFYHNVDNLALKGCQMILFEAYENAGTFITSDNPAFEHRSTVVEKNNSTGLVFPISPKYLIFIAKGNEGINVVDHRFANTDTIKKLNRMLFLTCTHKAREHRCLPQHNRCLYPRRSRRVLWKAGSGASGPKRKQIR